VRPGFSIRRPSEAEQLEADGAGGRRQRQRQRVDPAPPPAAPPAVPPPAAPAAPPPLVAAAADPAADDVNALLHSLGQYDGHVEPTLANIDELRQLVECLEANGHLVSADPAAAAAQAILDEFYRQVPVRQERDSRASVQARGGISTRNELLSRNGLVARLARIVQENSPL
jgi:hypothetical protein